MVITLFFEKRIGGGSSENEQSEVGEKVENINICVSFKQTLSEIN